MSDRLGNADGWHSDDECQLCDVYENICYWGPPITPLPHLILPYPEDPVDGQDLWESQDGDYSGS